MARGQLRLLLWKDWLIRKRKLITLGGAVWATLVSLCLYAVRVNIANQEYPTCQFAARALPSAGMLNFMQSFVCNINNECNPMDQYDEIPTYENSRLTQLQRKFSHLLSNESVIETAGVVPNALRLLGTVATAADEPTFLSMSKNGIRVKDLFQNPRKVQRYVLQAKFNLTSEDAEKIMKAEISLQGLVKGTVDRCDAKSLSEVVLLDAAVAGRLSQRLCDLDDKALRGAFVELLFDIDFSRYATMLGSIYSRLSGDSRVLGLAHALSAALRVTRMDSFVPAELVVLLNGVRDDGRPRYFNLTIVSNLISLFEPTFKDTESFKAVRGATDAAISGIQWLYRLYKRQANTDPLGETTGLILQRIDGDFKLDGSMLKKELMGALETADGGVSVDEVFDVLPKVTTFILRWLLKPTRHQVLFYSTLLAQLVEAADRVVHNNIHLELIVYNASLRHPAAVGILKALPVEVVRKAFEGLTDADRTQLLTSKMGTPEQMFCDADRLARFFDLPNPQAEAVKQRLCVGEWTAYIADLVQAFGIHEVKNNINAMAGLLIQETLGKDTTDQLYSMERSFDSLRTFTKDLLQLAPTLAQHMDWSRVLGLDGEGELLSLLKKEGGSKGMEALITIHGALAKEVVKQNTILEIKISPILKNVAAVVAALNQQLSLASSDVIEDFKMAYPQVLQVLLTTLMDEDKTYALLSTHNEDIFCNGTEVASQYLILPQNVDTDQLVQTLCDMTKEIEKGLENNSVVGNAFLQISKSSSQGLFSNVEWTKLTEGIKSLYMTLYRDYTYLFEVASFNMNEDMRDEVQRLLEGIKEFWFGRSHLSRSVQLSINTVFRALDLLDRNIFHLANEEWNKLKYSLNSANGILVICDDVLRLIIALSEGIEDFSSGLPPATVVALKRILPNLPDLIADAADIVVSDQTNLTRVVSLLNASPGWPCAAGSLSTVLPLRPRSKVAVRALEAVLCVNTTLAQEWREYQAARRVRTSSYREANGTTISPHLFLKLASNFNALVRDGAALKASLEPLLAENATREDGLSFVGAWKYAVETLDVMGKEDAFRRFFSRVDTVVNAINTSSIPEDTPLNILWDEYMKCDNFTLKDTGCSELARGTWQLTVKYISVMAENAMDDLFTYFQDTNAPDANFLQLLGFTKNTGLYIMYEKFADFMAVLLNSYWDYNFMNQIRRASMTQFWDCESVVDALVRPPGSRVSAADVARVKPYVCPSLLFWASLPRGENSLLDIVSKPQYYFYTYIVNNLTSNYENAYDKFSQLTRLLKDIATDAKAKAITEKDLEISSLQTVVNTVVDRTLTWKLNDTDLSYRMFNEINRKQFISSIYLTRIVAIISKIQSAFENLNVKETFPALSDEDTKKLQSDLQFIIKKFKRRPSDAVVLHFDVITKVLWDNEGGYHLARAVKSMCEDSKDTSILADDRRLLRQICSRNYTFLYSSVESDGKYDFATARHSLDNLMGLIKKSDEDVKDIFQFFGYRQELTQALKLTTKYADDLGLPIFIKYLQNNLRHYKVILSFLNGEDWWTELRGLYSGPHANTFFDAVESSPDIVQDMVGHVDQIHLVRLLRDINVNDSAAFCEPSVLLSDYIPDVTGQLSALKTQACDGDNELVRELPALVLVSQGYDNTLQLSKEIDYDALSSDLEETESRLSQVQGGPRTPQRPLWITDDKLAALKKTAEGLLSTEILAKMTFGAIGNIVDGSTLFLNNSQCSLCSALTSCFKQLGLQLVKKREYEALVCRLPSMTLVDVRRTLANDFHWDMALQELISTRNYTNLELNKAATELLEQIKLHVLDDLRTRTDRALLAECLARNVSAGVIGNASLVTTVLSQTLKLLRAQLPHIQDIPGMRDLSFLKQLFTQVAHNLQVERPLKDILRTDSRLVEELGAVIQDVEMRKAVEIGVVDLYALKYSPDSMDTWLILKTGVLEMICVSNNCTELAEVIQNNVDTDWTDKKLSQLQVTEFWRFSLLSDALDRSERLLGHVARLLGVVSHMDIVGALRGRLAAILDLVLQVMQKDVMKVVLFSLRGFAEELHPLLKNTLLEFDMVSLARGLDVADQYRSYVVENVDLKLDVSKVFANPERIESSLSALGINNTNFWSLAAPAILAGQIDLKPLINWGRPELHVSSIVCHAEDASRVILPGDVTRAVTSDDVFGALAEQFCSLDDARALELVPVLAENVNFSFVVEKVVKAVLSQVYSASNLTEAQGSAVLAKVQDLVSLMPVVQSNVGGLAQTLDKEPLFAALQGASSLNGLLSSSQFLASAGNMLCGKPFVANENRFYKAIAETKDFSSQPDAAQLEALPTDFCRSLYRDVIKMGGGKIIWSFVKPLILGRILYTPQTPAVTRIIEKANTSFALMSTLADIVHDFAGSFPSVQRLSEHRRALEALQALAAGPLLTGLGLEAGGVGGIDVDGLFDEVGDLEGIGSLLSKASEMLRCINLNRFHAAPDEAKLAHQAVRLTRVNEFAAGLVFMDIEEQGDRPINVEYKIRMDIESVPSTARIRNQFWTPGPEGNFLEDMRYFRGFVQIQDLVDSAIIGLSRSNGTDRRKRETASEVEDYGVYTQQIPYPCYTRDFFQSSVYESQALIVAFFFSLVFNVSSAIRFVVSEKESGNTMLMSVMGVDLSKHTLSWFIASMADLLLTCACVTAVLCGGGVLPRSDWTLLFALLVDFSFAVLMFCYLVSKLFKSASLAAVCGALGYLLTFMPFVIILSLEATLTTLAKLLTCLSMSTAFCYSLLHVARREAIGDGAHWAGLWRTDGDSISVGTAALMMLLDGLIYLAIGCIIDRFYGIKSLKSSISSPPPQEADDDVGISIVSVSKRYRGAKRFALRDVTLQLRRGEVTALLGHNGAGKSTLIAIITGMLRPTSGHVSRRARSSLGVCPQQDVLLPALTAAEHVAMYARIRKGGSADDVRADVDEMLSVLSLGPQSHIPVGQLSGGQRRRVCVALAFVARPQLVLLDEPSSGVDPLARRDIWTLIVRLKKSRAVLLTTHHLDEAELLSDRLVLMHQGQVHTIGSPIEIKRSLGNGYTLTVMYPPLNGKEDGRLEECSKKLLAAVRAVVRNGQIVEANGLEVEVNLPFYDADGVNNNFLTLSQSLESRKEELGFLSFTLDCSSLESIMHGVCGQTDSPSYGTVSSRDSADTPTQSASSSVSRNDQSCLVPGDGSLKGDPWAQFQALLYKRFLHYYKNKWLLFLLLALPSLFVTIAMAFSTIRPPPDGEVALRLRPQLYRNATQFTVPSPSFYPGDVDPTFAEDVMSLLLRSDRFTNWTEKDSPSCSCTGGRQTCERDSTPAAAPLMMALPDVGTLNQWLVTSQEHYIERRYGGITSALKNNRTALVAWYNNKGHHALPSFLNAVNSAVLRRVAGPRAAITVYTHPLKISHEQLSRSTLLQHVADAGISGMLLLAYSLLPAGAAIYLVLERTSQQKRLQLLCGVDPTLYWAAALLWDMLVIVLNIALTACVLSAFGFPVFVARDNLPAICLLLFLFGLSCTSLVHVLENLFSDASMANMVLFCVNTFAGVSGLAVLLILDIISESEATDNARWTLHKIFLLLPQFALGDALVEIAKNTVQAQVLSRFGMDTYVSPLVGPLIQYQLAALVLLTVLLQAFLHAREHGKLQAVSSWWAGPSERPPRGEEDPQVAAERLRVETALNEIPPLRLRTIGNINAGYIDTEEKPDKKPSAPRVVPPTCDVAHVTSLGKRYGARVAVADLTLGIPAGQCTALLGENGAGKSSTFAMLTGEIRPSWGRLYLRGVEVNSAKLRSGLISYCPQSDAIDPLLTVEKTLSFYCRLRGIEEEKEVISRTLRTFELTRYRSVAGAALSGGNRRKLCAALAFMGRGALVLLDEPTSGMDPSARACVWVAARAATANARGVLLSTHALRDAQRLAERVALMRAGRLIALGSLDDCLKRFGGGCVVCCRARSAGGAERAWRWLRARCPRASLRALHAHALQALLPANAALEGSTTPLQLSDVFRLLADMQASCDVDDYTLNQSSLDEMFLSFSGRSEESLHLDAEQQSTHEEPMVLTHGDELDSVTSL